MKVSWSGLLASLLLVVFAGLSIGSMWNSSLTRDELVHLPAGYSYLTTGDFRLNIEHPPLCKTLAAIPLLAFDLRPVTDFEGWAAGDQNLFGPKFLFENTTSLRRMLFVARLPIIALGVLTGLGIFLWAHALWGARAALFSLALFTFCPNFLAHSGLVTMDAGVACFSLWTILLLWRALETTNAGWMLLTGFALGLALLSKFTALLVLPMIPMLAFLHTRKIRTVVVVTGTVGIAAAVVVLIGWDFPHGWSNYLAGVRKSAAILSGPERSSREPFLWGNYSANGFWYYYLLAQLWKTPLPTLLSVAAVLMLPIAKDFRRGILFLLIPILLIHGASTQNPSNVGVRHVLMVFPFLFVLAGALLVTLRLRPKAAIAIPLLLMSWQAVGTARAFPEFVPWFNELVGGSRQGIHYLDDSNVEWGQDVDRLRDWIGRVRPAKIRLVLFSPMPPEEIGIRYDPIGLRDMVWPTPGVTYVIGANFLQTRTFGLNNDALRFEWLKRYEPLERIGGSIFIYRFSIEPTDADRSDVIYLTRQKWIADATDQLQRLLAISPEFTEGHRLLAEVQRHR